MSQQRPRLCITRIRSLLDRSSDIYLLLDDQTEEIRYDCCLPPDPDCFLEDVLYDMKRYLSLFDYLTVETFRMILETNKAEKMYSSVFESIDLSEREGIETLFYTTCYRYGLNQKDRLSFEMMLYLGESRRATVNMDAATAIRLISSMGTDFSGKAQCMRDRVIQIEMQKNGEKDLYLDYLLARSELFEYNDRSVFPDERRESNMVLRKLLRFSREYRIDREYYCELVGRLIDDGENDTARSYTEEGLAAYFPDSDDDKRSLWKLHFYRMLLAEDPYDAAKEADRLNRYPYETVELLGEYDRSSCAIVSGESYFKTHQYEKAEAAIAVQYREICDCLDQDEPVDLLMSLDVQFRILLLKAELLRMKKHPSEEQLLEAYRKCYRMIMYIHDCREKRGFVIPTEITAADERFIIRQMESFGANKGKTAEASTGYDGEGRYYTLLYDD